MHSCTTDEGMRLKSRSRLILISRMNPQTKSITLLGTFDIEAMVFKAFTLVFETQLLTLYHV